jgi:pantoate--beta-alanine ligase
MKLLRTINEVQALAPAVTGFVPTMGAFHEGHLDLMRAARASSERVVVSLFVNPTQFGPHEDLSRYPRDLERDYALAESVGVDVLFAPDPQEIYPETSTVVHVAEVTERWEGAFRPGHFDGVATVVLKLFNIVRPNHAYFGLKDLQQCLVVRRMVRGLNVPVQLSFLPTTREPDGLAMSSRNVYLSPDNRRIASELPASLNRLVQALAQLPPGDPSYRELLAAEEAHLVRCGFTVDYLAWVDLDAMRPCEDVRTPSAVVVAAKIGTTRLIDNRILFDHCID